jgi:hypothetical protein
MAFYYDAILGIATSVTIGKNVDIFSKTFDNCVFDILNDRLVGLFPETHNLCTAAQMAEDLGVGSVEYLDKKRRMLSTSFRSFQFFRRPGI